MQEHNPQLTTWHLTQLRLQLLNQFNKSVANSSYACESTQRTWFCSCHGYVPTKKYKLQVYLFTRNPKIPPNLLTASPLYGFGREQQNWCWYILVRYVPMAWTSFHLRTSSFHMAGTVFTFVDWFCESCQIFFASKNASCLEDYSDIKRTLYSCHWCDELWSEALLRELWRKSWGCWRNLQLAEPALAKKLWSYKAWKGCAWMRPYP